MSEGAMTVNLDQDGLDALERRLMIHARPFANGRERGGEAGAASADASPDRDRAAIDDILDGYRLGAKIAPQTESRPLLPLFAAASTPIPPEMKVDHEQLKYDFFSVEVIFSVLLPEGQYPASAELALRLSDDVKDPARRTRPIQLFPARQDVTYFSADLDAAVGIDASMQLRLPKTIDGLPMPFQDLSADAKLKAGIVVGPFHFPICRAAVEVEGMQSQDIFWRYNLQSTLTGANTFKSVLILKVAQEAQHVSFVGSLKVVPFKPSWLFFKAQLPALTYSTQLPVELGR